MRAEPEMAAPIETATSISAAAVAIGVAAMAMRTDRAGALPYAAWLPLQVPLVRRLMEARREAGVRAPVVALAFPDAIGPVLAAAGLAPDAGAGNVAEVAAKLAACAEHAREEVEVRLVMHHASERLAFGAFASPAGHEPDGARRARRGRRRAARRARRPGRARLGGS